MIVKIGVLYIMTGIVFFAYSAGCFFLPDNPVKLGFLANTILLIFDILWGLLLGFMLVITGGMSILKNRLSVSLAAWSGYAVIYSLIFFVSSFLFTAAANPHLQSNGRIFSYTLQALSRLFNPSFSLAFFIPFLGVILFILLSISFKQYFIEKLK